MKTQKESPSGNIWGWKFSLYGLALILILLGIMIYRHIALDVPFGTPATEADSSQLITN